MKVWPVDSRETMLKPQDIFAVAAHEYKEGIEQCKEAAKKVGVSPERMSYSIMVKEYSDPRLIRIRAGNTLFTIAAFPERIGFVRGYNADIAPNYVANIGEFIASAKKMGFNGLIAHATDVVIRAINAAAKRSSLPGVKVSVDKNKKLIFIKINDQRGE